LLGMGTQQKEDLFPETRNTEDLHVLNERSLESGQPEKSATTFLAPRS
jgi:hypothetical protein